MGSEKIFYLYGEEFEFDKRDLDSIAIHKFIFDAAYEERMKFYEDCTNKVHNFDELFTTGFKLFSDSFREIVIRGLYIIDRVAHKKISPEKFLEIGIRTQTLSVEETLQPLTHLLDILNEYIERLGIVRDIERNSRSEWTGGGFGLTGALWGTVQAGVLNYITDSIRGVADHYTNQKDLADIEKLKDKMYKGRSVEGLTPIMYLQHSLDDLAYGVYIETCNIIGIDTLEGNIEIADEVLERLNNCYPVKRADILDAIYNYPFYTELYYHIFIDKEDEYNELTKITDFVGLKGYFNNQVSTWFASNKIYPLKPNKNDTPDEAKKKLEQIDQLMYDYRYIPLDSVKPLVDLYKSDIKEHSKKAELKLSITSMVDDYLTERKAVGQLLKNNDIDKLWKMAQTTSKAYIPYKLRVYYENEFNIPAFTASSDVLDAFNNKHLEYLKKLQESGTRGVDYIMAFVNWKTQWIHNDYDKYTFHRKEMIKLAEKGNLFALGKIGELLIWPDEKIMPKKLQDVDKGVGFIVQAANALDPRAMFLLGKIYRIGIGYIKYDVSKAKLWLNAVRQLEPSFSNAVKEELEEIKKGKVGEKANEGCFITTAVCEYYGKEDDCYELTMFRHFRDTWLLKQADGKKLIKEYYDIAPIIVNNLAQNINNQYIYKKLWETYLLPCLKDIENNNMVSCKNRYINMIIELKNKYLR